MLVGALDRSNALILGVIAGIIFLIVLIGAIRNKHKGWKWILLLLIAGIIGYLYISADVLRIG